MAELLKSFQSEIDKLSQRSKAAEVTFLSLYKKLTDVTGESLIHSFTSSPDSSSPPPSGVVVVVAVWRADYLGNRKSSPERQDTNDTIVIIFSLFPFIILPIVVVVGRLLLPLSIRPSRWCLVVVVVVFLIRTLRVYRSRPLCIRAATAGLLLLHTCRHFSFLFQCCIHLSDKKRREIPIYI